VECRGPRGRRRSSGITAETRKFKTVSVIFNNFRKKIITKKH
jgi:hypothetical protein